jgi:hypothetical protein
VAVTGAIRNSNNTNWYGCFHSIIPSNKTLFSTL